MEVGIMASDDSSDIQISQIQHILVSTHSVNEVQFLVEPTNNWRDTY